MSQAKLSHRNRRVGLIFAAVALGMLGMGYAAVPIYRIFCQVTGFGGTPQIASEAKAATVAAADRDISIRFDSNVATGMPWTFEPVEHTMNVRIGERNLAFFTARNNSDQPVTGQASYKVVPERTAPYFTKVQCFCFTEQTLKPGEEVRMPVQFYVDPAMLDDETAKDVQQITLSYTFYKLENPSS